MSTRRQTHPEDRRHPSGERGLRRRTSATVAIRLERFRTLGDTGLLELRPLTVLVGKNSSGKSSFLRFLPLLRQSVEARTTGPVQWYGDYVDFGGFDETVSSFSKKKEIRFGFHLTIGHPETPRSGYYRFYNTSLDLETSVPCHLTLTIVPDSRDNAVTRYSSLSLTAAGHSIDITIDDSRLVARINGCEPLEASRNDLITRPGYLLPWIGRRNRSSKGMTEDSYLGPNFGGPLALDELVEALRPLFHWKTKDRTIREVAHGIGFGSDENILSRLRNVKVRGKRWTESVADLSVTSRDFQKIRNLVVTNLLSALIRALDAELLAFAKGVRYIKPVRATAERYYRQQDLAVDEVDSEGRNLATFLRSLTGAARRDFDKWVATELDWQIVPRLTGGHITLNIRDEQAREHNLADVGFGFSQILPVLAQLWQMKRGRGVRSYDQRLTLAIEQPELHLHPGLQARVADVLMGAITSARQNDLDLTVVVETHSETIVNRIGERIASGAFLPDDAAVILFEPGAVGEMRTTTATFDNEGLLQDWPFGFFEPD